jgi:hypothetical protein
MQVVDSTRFTVILRGDKLDKQDNQLDDNQDKPEAEKRRIKILVASACRCWGLASRRAAVPNPA